MSQGTLRLSNSVWGWILTPYHLKPEGAFQWLTEFYGKDYEKMKLSEKVLSFHQQNSDEAIARIKDMCKSLNFRVSFCGNTKAKGSCVVRLWK